MSDLPPTVEYSSIAPAPQYSRGMAIASWVIILLWVGLMFASSFVPQPPPESNGPQFQFEMSGKYAVGASKITSGLGAGEQSGALVGATDAAAETPVDRLRSTMVAGEIIGRDEASKRLNEFGSDETTAPLVATLRTVYSAGPAALDESQRKTLREDHGWFGRLALSTGAPDTDPDRAQVLREARRTVIVLFSLIGTILGGGVFGLVILIVLIVLLGTGRWKLAGPARDVPGQPFLEAFALYMILFFGAMTALEVAGVRNLWLTMALIVVLPVVAGWCRLRGIDWPDIRRAFGWHAGRGVAREVLSGVGGYVAGIPVVLLGFCVTMVLLRVSGAKPTHPITGAAGEIPAFTLYMLASVWAPIMEESMFRGALQHHLRSRHSWILTAAVSSLFFAAIHPQGWTLIPTLGAIGMVLSGLREWRGSLIAPVVGHALNNGVMITVMVLIAA